MRSVWRLRRIAGLCLEPLGLLLGILVTLARGDLIPAHPASVQRSNSL
jgi:hypothetical protein